MTEQEYTHATTRIEELLQTLTTKGNLTPTAQSELDRLSELVADYEEANFPFAPTTLREVVQLRMYQRKLKQKDLAKLLGTSPSRISEYLGGKRDLTLPMARALHQKLNIDAELILAA
jgi:HTH-type transcriptional regulator/antitoxin HigA